MSRPEPLARRLTPEERSLLRAVGQHLGHLLHDRGPETTRPELPEVDRQDELGMLVNMMRRVSRELTRTRARDEAQKKELEKQIAELEAARAEQEKLLATIRELSSPVLAVHQGILLVPLVGALDEARADYVTGTLLERIATAGAEVVILDVTGVSAMDPAVANRLLSAGRAAKLLGATPIVSGLSAEMARGAIELGVDLSALAPAGDLKGAIARAVGMVRGRQRG
ncbi:STAS domain-containing protein [Polyangium aurulentum]|uniref:STAS domain-containing protein n=1 Tax=Polyangium aurulentum TaxID=2567896 RepID=UPI0010AE428E|nr:STAS domain-containing protein [Polyangium aurulentum]UQA61984.1 STAS domain-containing protein [Polyangium aurulentum]